MVSVAFKLLLPFVDVCVVLSFCAALCVTSPTPSGREFGVASMVALIVLAPVVLDCVMVHVCVDWPVVVDRLHVALFGPVVLFCVTVSPSFCASKRFSPPKPFAFCVTFDVSVAQFQTDVPAQSAGGPAKLFGFAAVASCVTVAAEASPPITMTAAIAIAEALPRAARRARQPA